MEGFTFYAAKPVEKYHRMDLWLIISILLLWGLGIFTIFATSQDYSQHLVKNPMQYVRRQLISSAIGFVFFLFFAIMNMKVIRKFVPVIVIVSMILCFMTFLPFFGDLNGATRWLLIGNFSFQPSELVKFAVVLFIANYFDKQAEITDPEEQSVLPCVIGLMIFVALVFGEKDLSTALFILLIGIMMFFVSGAKLKWIWPFLVVAIPALFLMISLEPYRLERIIGFIKPNEMGSNVNYQSLNAKRAIISGGIWGNGIGNGLQKIRNIPEVQSDFIFAGWTEAMGFFGVFAYFVLLIFFAVRGYMTAFRNPSRFVSYATFGCVSLILLQSIVNTMVVCGLLPTTGIPLPFFSLGGSSIMITLAMCGFIVNASRCEEIKDENKNTGDENSIESLSIM